MRELIIQVTDDLCGAQLAEGEATLTTFSLDGSEYELDLCPSCRESLRDYSLDDLINAARQTAWPKVGAKPSDEFFEQFLNEEKTAYVCPYIAENDDCVPAGGPWTCGKTLSTAGGLSTHFGRIHKVRLRDWIEGKVSV